MRIHVLAVVCLLVCSAAAQTYMPFLSPHEQFLDNNGRPLAFGKVYTYAAGTTTKVATFTDSAGVGLNTNPIILDSAGIAVIFLDITKSYKIVVQNQASVQQWVADNVTGGIPTSTMTYPGTGIAVSTGTAWGTSYNVTNPIPANYVSLLNQNTTGNAATATALAATPALCPLGQFPRGILAVGDATGCTAPSGGSMTYPSGTGIPLVVAGTAWGSTYNASNQIPANFVPTLNQNTTGTAADITTTSNSTLTTLSALSLPYSQLSGTVPTWNQNTTGTAANLSGTQTANFFYAAPNGSSGAASFRAMVAADVPTLNQNTTGTAAALTGTPTLCTAGQYARGILSSGNATGCTAVTAPPTIASTTNLLAGDGAGNAVSSGIAPANVSTLVYNTPQINVTSISGNNTIIGSQITMASPGADRNYNMCFEAYQTVPGSTGTCTAGTVSLYVLYTDAETGVVCASPNCVIGLQALSSQQTIATSMTLIASANGNNNHWFHSCQPIRVKGGTNLQYRIQQVTGNNCTIPTQFTVRPQLWDLGP